MTFIQREITLQITLGNSGVFNLESEFGAANNTVTLAGLRVQCSIQQASGPGLGNARIRVYGLTPSLLAQLSKLNAGDTALQQNMITVLAGDSGAAPAVAFIGLMSLSQVDMSAQPEVALNIMAHAGLAGAVQKSPPTSYPGSADVADILASLAATMGYGFENNADLHVYLSTPYLPGSPLEQARRCAEAARINWTIDAQKNVLAIWPIGGSRGGLVPLVSAETGMIGYPTLSSGGAFNGIAVTTLFNPLLRIGGQVRVESGLKAANATWLAFNISHELESLTPGGQWLTHFDSTPSYG